MHSVIIINRQRLLYADPDLINYHPNPNRAGLRWWGTSYPSTMVVDRRIGIKKLEKLADSKLQRNIYNNYEQWWGGATLLGGQGSSGTHMIVNIVRKTKLSATII